MKKRIATTLGLLFLLLFLTATVSETLAADASSWGESKTREAGCRAILEVEGAEYGFVWIPVGEFDMGSPDSEEGRCVDEVLHRVKLTRGFWLLETPTP